MAEYSGEFSYLNFSMKIRQKIDEWMKTAAPDVSGTQSAILRLRPRTILINKVRLPQMWNHSKSDGERLNFSLVPL